MWKYFVHIVIPVAEAATANALAVGIDPDVGGAETFNKALRLSASGAEPATHLAVSVLLKQVAFDQMPGLRDQVPGSEYVVEAECGMSLLQYVASRGFKVIQEQQ